MSLDAAEAPRARDLADLSVAELAAGFAAGAFDPVDALDAAFARIDAFDGAVNAFVFQDRATSRAMAEASALRHAEGRAIGALDGVTVSVKDLTPVSGWPNRRGSLALDPHAPAPEDAPAAARLREAGAVFLGKTATPESGSRIVTRSAVHGVTRNPWALDRTPGGSSGGAAAALALGMGALATGTDGAGSIRIPAAFCNLVGLKPGFGRVPAYPPSHFMPHSVTGPMARRIADLVALTEAMARPEPRDPYAWPVPFDAAGSLGPVAGLRIAVSPDLGTGSTPGPDVLAALDAVAGALSDAGAAVEAASPDWPVPPERPFLVFWETSYAAFLDLHAVDTAAAMAPLLHDIAARGRGVDCFGYHRAVNDRLAIATAAHAFLTRFDAVLAPVMPGAPFDVAAESPPGERPDDWRWAPYCYPFNMTGQPALSVPGGFDGDGLPIGVQLAARAGREEMLLRLGAAAEERLGYDARRPPLLSGAAALQEP